ncbi:hypothetical protein LTR37_013008 [Vermiconidia calcicola]|uniref:Uncharacterized protein n=1 Tax=Vermiconidia calcicola TaxID=1690605 RepID=A0ACC3MY01_9PEZI|nr:hypothetical protein LTR37_013008 [Vermiconidia calcicola]
MSSYKSASSASGGSSDRVHAKHESHIAEPQLRSLEQPIAVRLEYIAHKPTKIIILQHEYTSLGRDYTIRDGNDEILKPKLEPKTQLRRCFRTASFHSPPAYHVKEATLVSGQAWRRSKRFDESQHTLEFHPGADITVQKAAAGGAETQIELMEIGPHGRKASISANGVDLATIHRTAPDGSNGDNLSERASFKRRPIWTIHIAEGMDVSLVSLKSL